jgi:hypothetical protein
MGNLIEKVSKSGIKITEKKVLGEKVWFRVVTPSGKAGWVELSYIKLEGAV